MNQVSSILIVPTLDNQFWKHFSEISMWWGGLCLQVPILIIFIQDIFSGKKRFLLGYYLKMSNVFYAMYKIHVLSFSFSVGDWYTKNVWIWIAEIVVELHIINVPCKIYRWIRRNKYCRIIVSNSIFLLQ